MKLEASLLVRVECHPPYLEKVANGRDFRDAWYTQGFNASDKNGYNLCATAPLIWTNLVSAGRYAIGRYQYRTAGRHFDVSGVFADWQVPNATCTTTGARDLQFRTLAWCGGNSVNAGSVDDIRFGDSLASVTPSIGPTPPKAPARLRIDTAHPGQIDLTWTDRAETESDFIVERRLGVTDYVIRLIEFASNTTGFKATNVLSGMAYAYRVRATNHIGGRPGQHP